MGRDFVAVQTMASLSAPGSFSLIKQRDAQKLIQSHSSLFSRFQALASGWLWWTCCLTPRATTTMCGAKQSRGRGWGLGESGGSNGKHKTPMHKPTKPELRRRLNSLQCVKILLNASCHWQRMKRKYVFPCISVFSEIPTVCGQQVMWVPGSADTAHYVEKSIFQRSNQFYSNILNSVSGRVIWTSRHPFGSVNSFAIFAQHSDFLCTEQILCEWPRLKPLWSVKKGPQMVIQSAIQNDFLTHLKKGLCSFTVSIFWAQSYGFRSMREVEWSRSHIQFRALRNLGFQYFPPNT